jgi:outer membrane protein, adhesin transport system
LIEDQQMPSDRKNGTGRGVFRLAPALGAIALLSGCMGGGDRASQPSFAFEQNQTAQATPGSSAEHSAANSSLIADLQARKSVLPPSGPYAQVADAVVAASAGAAEAELRVARLRADARAKNWLPSIGPSVNLTSLGGLATSLLLDQPVFDNGGRRAQREFAAADVEVAAVSLSTALNQRVYEGLSYYVNAERARAQAAVSRGAASHLAEFSAIMRKRVAGGISDLSEQRVLDQHMAEMQATVAADAQAESAAMAELAALAGQPLTGLHGLDSLTPSQTQPLSILKARGEGARTIAQSIMQLSGMKLGIAASAGLGRDGASPGLRMTGTGLLNPGTKSDIAALRQTPDLVDRQNAEAAEAANRRLVALQQQRVALASRQAQGAEVLRQTSGNLDLFTTQYKVGRRTLLELVSQYDSYARLQRDQASLGYDIALIDLEIARDRGVLVEGSKL